MNGKKLLASIGVTVLTAIAANVAWKKINERKIYEKELERQLLQDMGMKIPNSPLVAPGIFNITFEEYLKVSDPELYEEYMNY